MAALVAVVILVIIIALPLLLAFGLPLGLSLLLPLVLLFKVGVVFFRGQVSVPFECLLVEQEVDLHALVRPGQMALTVHCDHLVQRGRFLLIVDLEHDAQFVLALATAIGDWGHIYSLGSETRQELHSLGFAFTVVEVVRLRLVLLLLVLICLEEMDLELEGRFFLLDRLNEEVWIVLVVLTVVRVGIDLVRVEALMLRLPIVLVIPIVVLSTAKASIVVSASAFAVVPTLSPLLIIIGVVIATTTGTTSRLTSRLLVASAAIALPRWRVCRPIVLPFVFTSCVSSIIRLLTVTIVVV